MTEHGQQAAESENARSSAPPQLERALTVLGGVLWDIAGNTPASSSEAGSARLPDSDGDAAVTNASEAGNHGHESAAADEQQHHSQASIKAAPPVAD